MGVIQMLWGRTVIDTVRFFSEKRHRPVSVLGWGAGVREVFFRPG